MMEIMTTMPEDPTPLIIRPAINWFIELLRELLELVTY